MVKISLVAAVDEKNGLGKNNQLLCHLPADLKHFKAITLNKPILMGYKTFLSIGRPLPSRDNIVLSRSSRKIEGVYVVHSLAEGLACACNQPELMVIGGALVFNEVIDLADTIYLTVIHGIFDADVFFPRLNEAIWERHTLGFHEKDEKNPFAMTFYKLTRIKSLDK